MREKGDRCGRDKGMEEREGRKYVLTEMRGTKTAGEER
jgi:hypothetical protein